MPEGDTIHHAAERVGAALVGRSIESIETPQPRHAMDRWPERLADRGVQRVDARGKHLFVRFEGELTLHSHLRMTGKWGVYRRGQRWRRSPHRAWLVLRTRDHEVVQFDGPVLELMTEGRTRFDQRLAALGPDVLDDGFSTEGFLRRLRAAERGRAIGDALLDQRIVAGFGNVWKAEACHLAGIDPWRTLDRLSDAEALRLVDGVRPLMRRSAERGGRIVTVDPDRSGSGQLNRYWVYGREGRPCRRCATPIRARGQGDDNRTTFWCPACQR